METIYTILFTAPGMPVTLFAASSRALLAHKVRDAANERIAMLKWQVKDLRNYFENDIRFLRQFEAAI